MHVFLAHRRVQIISLSDVLSYLVGDITIGEGIETQVSTSAPSVVSLPAALEEVSQPADDTTPTLHAEEEPTPSRPPEELPPPSTE